MTKHSKIFSIGLALLVASMATGCELYFEDNNDDGWAYCAADGYYVDGDYVSPTCPGGGNACASDRDCAAGCYCVEGAGGSGGVCEEAGFCSTDEDCPRGYTCDERSSCVPNEAPQCTTDEDCAAGTDCVDGSCETSCVCQNDAEAQAQGYHHCDEARQTCEQSDDGGTCSAEVVPTCNVAKPQCVAGSVPLIVDGCYTGECSEITRCDVEPLCPALQHETDCLGRTGECGAVYVGIDCTKPDGTACQAGDTNCTCESFRFNSCRTSTQALIFE